MISIPGMRRRFGDVAAGAVRNLAALRATTPPDSGPLVVLAPHFDDEILGCGGLMRHVSRSGGEVHLVFATDGTRALAPGHTPANRLAESKAALDAMGARAQITLLDLPETELPERLDQLTEALDRTLRQIRPGLLVVTSVTDLHRDHVALAQALERLVQAQVIDCPVFTYAVWQYESLGAVRRWLRSGTPDRRSVRVWLGPVGRRRKARALRQFASQLDPAWPDNGPVVTERLQRRLVGLAEVFVPLSPTVGGQREL